MNIKRLLLGLVLALFAQVSFGQSMSDDEVVAMGRRLKAGGDDNKTVTAKVLQAGATKEQLMRIANSQKAAQATAAKSVGSTVGDIDRINNGEQALFDSIPNDTAAIERKIFGQDIFRTKNLTFEPNSSMAIASDYVVGPGDDLIVDIYGASQSSNRYKVSPDGYITIPKIGPIAVSGMTVDAAQTRIYNTIGKHYQNANIKLSVGQTRTIQISVMGEVHAPGSYTLSAFATVFHALYMAGGTSSIGTLRDIKVVRNGRIISTIDIYQYILKGRLAGDVKLRDNDVIMVGTYNNLVEITGNVKRPMWYEMKKDESLATLLEYAGGFTGDAFSKSISIRRSAGDRMSVCTVDEFDYTTFKLSDEDVVTVRGNDVRYENVVNITGAITRPGRYELQKVGTLRELLNQAGGLREEANVERAILTRLNPDRTLQTISFEPQGILSGTTPDIALKNEDNIVIASNSEFNDNRFMQITGEVMHPGHFTYSSNTTLADLITMAGGLQESASLMNVEIARRIIDPSATTDQEVRTETFNFALVDGAEHENGSDFIIKPYDFVYIRRSPVFNPQSTVTVSGEVMFAGSYALENQTTRLSDIIKRAGGLKKNSYAANARVVRQMSSDEIAREQELIKLSKMSKDSVNISKQTLKLKYNVGVNLQKALDNPGGPDDIVLRDSDEVIVPMFNNTVKVNGAVLYPNTLTYDKDRSWKDYINEAGGFTKQSLKRRAYIVYANGHVARARRNKVLPGCEIVVPVKPEKDEQTLTTASKWISITSALATTAAVVLTAIK